MLVPKKKLITDVSKYGSSTILSQIIKVVKGIIIANVLGPAYYGIWSTLQVILNWGEMSHLGLKDALMVERPLLLGAKKRKEANMIRDIAISTTLLISSLFAIGVIIASIVFKFPPLLLQTSWVIAVVSIFFQLYSSLSVLIRTEEKFGGLSKGILLLSVAGLVLTLIFIFPFGLWGVIAAFFLAHLLVIFYFKKKYDTWFKLRFNTEKAKALLKIGIGLFILSSMMVLLRTVDKAIIAWFLNMEQVGFYSIGVVISSFLYLFPSAIIDVIYPRMLIRLGETNSTTKVKRHALLPNIFLSHILPFIIGVVYMLVPLVIRFITPQYISAIGTSRILLLGAFFFSLYFSPVRVLIAVKKYKLAIAGALFALLVNIVVNYFMVTNGYGIDGVAMGTLFSYVLLSSVMIISLMTIYPKQNATKYIINLFYPFIWLLAAVFITDTVFSDGISIMITAKRLVLSMIVMLPLAYIAEKQTKAFSEVWSVITGKTS